MPEQFQPGGPAQTNCMTKIIWRSQKIRAAGLLDEIKVIIITKSFNMKFFGPAGMCFFSYQHNFSAQSDPRLTNFVKLLENLTLALQVGI
jgi:hypothetical protein